MIYIFSLGITVLIFFFKNEKTALFRVSSDDFFEKQLIDGMGYDFFHDYVINGP
jgi:hypothetical protein